MTDQLFDLPIKIGDIQRMIPHRYPFLMLDRIVDYRLDPDKYITAIKNVTNNEPYFTGHFPDHPVMPGVMIIEAIAQAAGCLAHLAKAKDNSRGALYYLAKVEKARFSRTVIPGDQLVMEVQQLRVMRGMGLYKGQALVDGKRVASAEIMCAGRGG
jgi:3-hydroxyacyl-[acyl-carrier-protein] dehydratase